MKWFIVALIAAVLCLGCSMTEEAYYLDREYGKAQMESWDKMIAHPDYRYADRQPEGLEGVHAEPAMDVYHRSFSKEPTESDVIQFGIIGE